jgi:hypothetical protein
MIVFYVNDKIVSMFLTHFLLPSHYYFLVRRSQGFVTILTLYPLIPSK